MLGASLGHFPFSKGWCWLAMFAGSSLFSKGYQGAFFSKGCNSTGDNGMVLNQKLQTNMQCTFHLQHTAKSSWPMFEQKLVNQNRWNSPTENQYWNQYQNQYWNQYQNQSWNQYQNQYWNQYQNQYWNQYFYPKKSISKILILSIFFEKSISIFFHRKILIEINIGCSGFM